MPGDACLCIEPSLLRLGTRECATEVASLRCAAVAIFPVSVAAIKIHHQRDALTEPRSATKPGRAERLERTLQLDLSMAVGGALLVNWQSVTKPAQCVNKQRHVSIRSGGDFH